MQDPAPASSGSEPVAMAVPQLAQGVLAEPVASRAGGPREEDAITHLDVTPAVGSQMAGASRLPQRYRVPEVAARASSSTGTGALATIKNVQDTSMLAVVRRQMEALEEKLHGQITRSLQQSDRLRDAAVSRVDQKMGIMEIGMPKLDRRLAELSGNYKGLSDEMQAQIRRIDQMDSRLWDCRKQLEEDIHKKFESFEQAVQQIQSTVRMERTANDDALKRFNRRLTRLEGLIEERLTSTDAKDEEVRLSISDLHGRLSDMEQLRAQDLALSTVTKGMVQDTSVVDRAALEALRTQMSDGNTHLTSMQQDYMEIYARLQTQEERLKSLSTKFETKEEQWRALSDRFERADLEGRVKDIHAQLKDIDQFKVKHGEKLELLQKNAERHEQTLDNMTQQNQDRDRALRAYAEIQPPVDQLAVRDIAFMDGVGKEEIQELPHRCRDIESRLAEVDGEIRSMRADVDVAPRVAQLVDQLKQVAPKVMDHEVSVRDLHEKVGRLEVLSRMETDRIEHGGSARSQEEVPRIGGVDLVDGQQKAFVDGVTARVHRLEVEVERLKTEIEGGDMPEVQGNQFVEVVAGDDEEDDEDEDGAEQQMPLSVPRRQRRASATE